MNKKQNTQTIKTKILTKEAVDTILPCKPSTDEEKETLFAIMAEFTDITKEGLKSLVKKWEKWNIHYKIPFLGITRLSPALLKTVSTSGFNLTLGLLELSDDDARILVKAKCSSVWYNIFLPNLDALSASVAQILCNQYELGFCVSGHASMTLETLQIVCLKRTDAKPILLKGISDENAMMLSRLDDRHSLDPIDIANISDRTACLVASAKPWFSEENIYFTEIPITKGFLALARRFGQESSMLCFKCLKSLKVEVARALVERGSILNVLSVCNNYDNHICNISDDAICALVDSECLESLVLGIDSISIETANILARFSGEELNLPYVTTLSTAALLPLLESPTLKLKELTLSLESIDEAVLDKHYDALNRMLDRDSRIQLNKRLKKDSPSRAISWKIMTKITPELKIKHDMLAKLVNSNQDILSMSFKPQDTVFDSDLKAEMKDMIDGDNFDPASFYENLVPESHRNLLLGALSAIYKPNLALSLTFPKGNNTKRSQDILVSYGDVRKVPQDLLEVLRGHGGTELDYCDIGEFFGAGYDEEMVSEIECAHHAQAGLLYIDELDLHFGISEHGARLIWSGNTADDKWDAYTDSMLNLCTYFNMLNKDSITIILARDDENVLYGVLPDPTAAQSFLDAVRPVLQNHASSR